MKQLTQHWQRKMANLQNKHILVVDLSGSYTHIAERLAKEFGKVMYWSSWQTGFSTVARYLPGFGLPDIENVATIFDRLNDIDAMMFTDVGHGDLQEFMRSQGIPVFGSGAGQLLELDRIGLKETLKKAGMDVGKYRVVRGIENLRALLKKEKDLYIKFSWFRAEAETFHHKNWTATQTWLDNFSMGLGPYGKIATFLVEEPIDDEAIEVGYDTWAVDGELPEQMLWGYEIKDKAFVGTTDPLPPRLQRNATQWSNILKQFDYRGMISTEVRVTEDKDYLIDPTCRCPSPPSEAQCALIENFGEIVWEGAHGNLIEPVFKNRYAAQLILESQWLVEHALELDIGMKDRVFIHGHFKIDGKDYSIIPEEFSEFGGAVGLGDTLEDAIKEAYEAAESVEGHQVFFDRAAFSTAMESIEQGEKLGITWASVPKIKKSA